MCCQDRSDYERPDDHDSNREFILPPLESGRGRGQVYDRRSNCEHDRRSKKEEREVSHEAQHG